MKKTIGELLFEGYEDEVMEIGSSLDGDDDEEYFDEEEEETKQDLNKVPMDKFGWFYKVRKNHEQKILNNCKQQLVNYKARMK